MTNKDLYKNLPTIEKNNTFINYEFFGPACLMDFVKDIEYSHNLGIDVAGKPRDLIKAEILSLLTGKPIDIMYNFFNASARLDNYIDKEIFQALKMHFTSNLNANKALIINKLIEINQA